VIGLCQVYRERWFCDCCAAEREQARSPQGLMLGWLIAAGRMVPTFYQPPSQPRQTQNLWRASLLALGRAAAPKPVIAICQEYRERWFYDCCAAERGQAPSPQNSW